MFVIATVMVYKEFTVAFECILTHAKNIKGSNYGDFSNLRVRRVNRTNFLLVGNMTFLEDIGNEHQIEMKILKKLGNQYQLTPYRLRKENYCDFVRDHGTYDDLRKVSNIPAKDVCPWPKVR